MELSWKVGRRWCQCPPAQDGDPTTSSPRGPFRQVFGGSVILLPLSTLTLGHLIERRCVYPNSNDSLQQTNLIRILVAVFFRLCFPLDWRDPKVQRQDKQSTLRYQGRHKRRPIRTSSPINYPESIHDCSHKTTTEVSLGSERRLKLPRLKQHFGAEKRVPGSSCEFVLRGGGTFPWLGQTRQSVG